MAEPEKNPDVRKQIAELENHIAGLREVLAGVANADRRELGVLALAALVIERRLQCAQMAIVDALVMDVTGGVERLDATASSIEALLDERLGQ